MKAYYVQFVRGTITRTNWFWDYQAAMAWLTLELGRETGTVQSVSITRRTIPDGLPLE